MIRPGVRARITSRAVTGYVHAGCGWYGAGANHCGVPAEGKPPATGAGPDVLRMGDVGDHGLPPGGPHGALAAGPAPAWLGWLQWAAPQADSDAVTVLV